MVLGLCCCVQCVCSMDLALMLCEIEFEYVVCFFNCVIFERVQ